MSAVDPARQDSLADFDIDGIDRAVADWQPVARPSQRRAARQLVPLIKHILAARPDLPTAEVRRILEANHRSGPLANSKTFNRELGAICNEMRSVRLASKPSVRPSRTRARTVSQPKPQATRSPMEQDIGPSRAGEVELVPTPRAVVPTVTPAPPPAHPLDLFEGKFSGKVFVHTPAIRAFFSAIDKRGDDALLARLARQVTSDAASRACLDQLHPRDRAILEAALSLR